MEWYEFALRVGAVVSVLLVVGGAWALVRGSFNKARVHELRDHNDDLYKRLDDAEKVIKAHEIREDAMSTQIAHQQTEIDMLTQMVTQRADVVDVKIAVVSVLENLKEHHEEAKQYWTGINTALTVLLEEHRREGKGQL